MDALNFGKTLTTTVSFVCGRAEDLPFSDCSFEFVIARVSLPYTNILRSLSEISRVLKPEGRLWALFERVTLPFRTGMFRNPRFYVFLPYLVLNTAIFHTLVRSIPFVDGRYRGYQTASSIRRALAKVGLEGAAVTQRPCVWETTAIKPLHSPSKA
jgi:ubiquinone/menaquinone biosynthesis C-methylase UbiE